MIMTRIRRFTVALALLLPLGPAAYASRPPIDPGSAGTVSDPGPVTEQQPVLVVAHHDAPLWLFLVVAVVAAAVTVGAQLILRRMPAARRRLRHA